MAGGVVSNVHWTIVSDLYIYNVVCRYGPVCCLWHLYIVVFRSFSVLHRVVLFLNKLFYLVSYVVLCHWIMDDDLQRETVKTLERTVQPET